MLVKNKFIIFLGILAALLIITPCEMLAQKKVRDDSKRKLLQDAKVEAARKEIEITVNSVDISNFPEIKIIIEAYNKLGEPLDTLTSENLYVFENGVSKKVIKVEKIPVAEVVPADFIFVIDKTGSMQPFINAVKSNLLKFTSTLMKRGIDYRLGLVLFSDDVEKIYQPSNNALDLLDWLSAVKARGGGDEKENSLEALEYVTKIDFRDEANKVVVLITDAPYHEKTETGGHGVTNQTKSSIIELLQVNDIRVFSIVPKKLQDYAEISAKTRGNAYDIDYPFSTILDNFSKQLTNLFALTYRSDQTAIPDSIEIGLLNEARSELLKKTIPIVELGRKLIIENLLYKTASAELPDTVKELEILQEFMKSKPNVVVMVEGHTDNIGSHAVNDRLSLERAESVKRYLIRKGISEHRIKTKGYGERRPIASNRDEFGRRLNRRTEIIIIAK
ncbi:MAG: OmpA family protein [Bacteroidota bacterium]